jgi:hypothetical protein
MWQHPFQKKNVGLKNIEKGICDKKIHLNKIVSLLTNFSQKNH